MEDSVFHQFDDSNSNIFRSNERNNSSDKHDKDCSAQIRRREEEQLCMNRLCYNNRCNSKVDSNELYVHRYGQYYGKDDNRIDNMYESNNETGRDACKLISTIEHVEPSTLPSATPSKYEQTCIHEPLITHIPTLCTTINDGGDNRNSNTSNCCDDRTANKESNKVIRATPNVAFTDAKNTITHNEMCNLNKKEELHLMHESRKYTQNDSNKVDENDDDEFEDKAFVNSTVHNRKCITQDKLYKRRKQVELYVEEEQRNQTHDLPSTAKNEQSISNSFAISNTSIHDKPLVPNCNNLVEHNHTKIARKHGTHRHDKEVNNNTSSVSYSNDKDKSDSHRSNNTTTTTTTTNNNNNNKEVLQSESGTYTGKHSNKVTSTISGKVQQEEPNKNEEYKSNNDENNKISNNNNNSSCSSSTKNDKNIYYNYLIGHHSNMNDTDNSVEQESQVQNKYKEDKQYENHNNAHSLSFPYFNTSEQVEESVSSRNASSSVGNKYIKKAKYSSGDDDNDDSTSSNNHDDSGNDHVSEEEHSELASNDNSVDESGHTAAERSFIDEFGFVIDEETKAKNEQYLRAIDGRQVARREVKWANMAADWENTNTKMFAKLKERCRKGIPARFRGVAWQLLLHSWHQMNLPSNAGVYVALREKKLSDKEVDATIARDRARTFPNHVLFKDDDGVGQRFLCNVLHAYAASDPEVGYVQGMAFLVAALSTQMGEEECFWALHEMMYNRRYNMRELYKPGFPLLHQFFYQLKRLIRRLLPRLGERFEKLEVDPSFYASQWFLTLFVYHFSFRSLLRIWDIFFCEGWKIIFRTGIALMRWEEERLLSLPFDELLPALKNLQDGKNLKEVIRRAHQVKFKTSLLDRYALEYQRYVRSSHIGKGDVFKNTEYDYLEKLKDKLRPSWMN